MFYLGIDFLYTARKARQNILSRGLISVPTHLEHAEVYLHTGKLPDDKYRLPWKRATADQTFLIEECSNILKDELLPGHVDVLDQLEPLDTTADVSLSRAVNFDLDLELVPSSNPSTPDVFTPDDFFAEQNIFQETFYKDDPKQYTTDYDKLKIDIPLLERAPVTSKAYLPSLQCLVASLPAVNVSDPLLTTDGCRLTEQEVFCESIGQLEVDSKNGRKLLLQQTFDTSVIDDKFHKYEDLHRLGKKNDLEVPITDETILPDTEAVGKTIGALLHSLTQPLNNLPVEEVESVTVAVSRVLSSSSNDQSKVEQLPADATNTYICPTSFLDVNEIIITEQDTFCEKAMLSTPEQSPTVPDPHSTSLVLPDRSPIEIPGKQKCFLTKEEIDQLCKVCYEGEKYCDEILASRLPEPDIVVCEPVAAKPSPVTTAARVLGASPVSDIGKLDLQLSWDVFSYKDLPVDPCAQLATLGTNKADCPVVLDEVEPTEKYSSAMMCDWEDQLITKDVMESANVKTVTKQQNVEVKSKQQQVSQVGVLPVNRKRELPKELCPPQDFGPLGDFMALRLQSVSSEKLDLAIADRPVEQLEAENNEQAVLSPESTAQIVKIKQGFESKNRICKHHVLKIKLSDEFQHIVDLLESSSAMYIQKLVQSGDISASCTFQAVTPDISRFLLKQREKYLADNAIDCSTDEVLRNIVCLHALAGSAEITTNCCLESAIAYLGAVHDQYKTVVSTSLDSVRQQLFEMNAQRKMYHPKVVKLCKEIETWLKKKRSKSKDNEQRILLLVKRDMPSLLTCLQNALDMSQLLSSVILSSTDSEKILTSLDRHNCLIAQQGLITESFPWAQFSLVVEYEHRDNSQWQQLCERQKIRHIAIQLDREHPKESVGGAELRMKYPDRQITLIGSHNVTHNIELLQLLEARCNILLVERDYSLMTGTGHLHFSDIDVDENTAIVLEQLGEMADDCVVQNLVTKITALGLKYTHIWVVIVSTKSGSYSLPGHVVSNISRLHAAVANFLMKENHLFVKIVHCEKTSEVASLIRHVSESRMVTQKERSISHWLHRTWICHDISKVEKFLLMIPCISSFNAQLLLEDSSLKTLLTATVPELAKSAPWIAETTLQTLRKLCTHDVGLHLVDDCDTEWPVNEQHDGTNIVESSTDNMPTKDVNNCENLEEMVNPHFSEYRHIPTEAVNHSENLEEMVNPYVSANRHIPHEAVNQTENLEKVNHEEIVNLYVTEDFQYDMPVQTPTVNCELKHRIQKLSKNTGRQELVAGPTHTRGNGVSTEVARSNNSSAGITDVTGSSNTNPVITELANNTSVGNVDMVRSTIGNLHSLESIISKKNNTKLPGNKRQSTGSAYQLQTYKSKSVYKHTAQGKSDHGANGWENLNEFVAEKNTPNATEVNGRVEGHGIVNVSTELPPVKKLQKLRERAAMTIESYQFIHPASSHDQFTQQQATSRSQYFNKHVGETVKPGEQIVNRQCYEQQNVDNFNAAVKGSSDVTMSGNIARRSQDIVRDMEVNRQYSASNGRECSTNTTVYTENHRNQTVQSMHNEYVSNTDNNQYRIEHQPRVFQNEIGSIKTTFDYNHGLPYTNLPQQNNNTVNATESRCPINYQLPERLPLSRPNRYIMERREREFPSVDEIDNCCSLEREPAAPTQTIERSVSDRSAAPGQQVSPYNMREAAVGEETSHPNSNTGYYSYADATVCQDLSVDNAAVVYSSSNPTSDLHAPGTSVSEHHHHILSYDAQNRFPDYNSNCFQPEPFYIQPEPNHTSRILEPVETTNQPFQSEPVATDTEHFTTRDMMIYNYETNIEMDDPVIRIDIPEEARCDRGGRNKVADKQEVRFDFNPKFEDDYTLEALRSGKLDIGVKAQSHLNQDLQSNTDLSDKFDRIVAQSMSEQTNNQINHNMQNREIYINPKIDRISIKPYVSENITPGQGQENRDVNIQEQYARTLADDLRETTRKYLANSQQFSRFGNHSSRHPLQKVNIGLAQPLQRQKITNNNNTIITDGQQEVASFPQCDQLRMSKSPWAVADSPPMDLQYENSQMNSVLYPGQQTPAIGDGCNRAVFTSQTPSKRRKLTYQTIPGKRGQTRLVFE